MAYQNVGTPRFYINDIDYAKSVGLDVTDIPDHLTWHLSPPDFGVENYLNLINSDPNVLMVHAYDSNKTAAVVCRTINRQINFPNYVAYLNHNMNSCKVNIRHAYFKEEGDESGQDWNGGSFVSPIVNAEFESLSMGGINTGHFAVPDYDGFSIYEITNNATDEINTMHTFQMYIDDDTWNEGAYIDQGYPPLQVGSIWVGRYYDMPHSPELDLTMTIENDGFESIITEGGAHLSNVRYTGAPMWERHDGTEIPPWTIGEPTSLGRRNGRRVWSLSFNYLSDSDLFASNYMSNTYSEEGSLDSYDDGDKDIQNLSGQLLENPNFDVDSDASGFTSSGALAGWDVHTGDGTFTLSSDQLTFNASGTANQFIYTEASDVKFYPGKKYTIIINVASLTGGQKAVVEEHGGHLIQTIDTAGQYTIEHTFVNTLSGYDYNNLVVRRLTGISGGTIVLNSVKAFVHNPSDFTYTLDNDDSFHAQVLNRIGNGQRFIFQPDNNNNNPDQFAICQLDQESLNIRQVAYKTYNIKLKIREVW